MFALIDPKKATGPAQTLLQEVQGQLGRVPNLYKAMANSPKALAAYLAFRGALQSGTLDAPMSERVALLTAELNECDYCVAAHSFRGGRLGMSEAELRDTRRVRADEPRTQAALRFIAALIEGRGRVDVAVASEFFALGWTEAEAGELVAHVALNVFSNYFQHLAAPPLDFPAVAALDAESAT